MRNDAPRGLLVSVVSMAIAYAVAVCLRTSKRLRRAFVAAEYLLVPWLAGNALWLLPKP